MKQAFLVKVFVAFLAIWFFAGVVLLSLPNPYLGPCTEKCAANGFDTVLQADAAKCWCRSSISRDENIFEFGDLS